MSSQSDHDDIDDFVVFVVPKTDASCLQLRSLCSSIFDWFGYDIDEGSFANFPALNRMKDGEVLTLKQQLRSDNSIWKKVAKEKRVVLENLRAITLGYTPREERDPQMLLNRITDEIEMQYVADIIDCDGQSCCGTSPSTL